MVKAQLQKTNDDKIFAIPEGTTIIDLACFRNCNIEKIIIPSSIQHIYTGVIGECSNLKTIVLAEGLQNIKNDWFANTNITEITIP